MEQPAIILCRPQMGENIGAAARVMANFSLCDLRLVGPRDGWPNPAATAMAAGADHILDGVSVFDSLDAALHDRTRAAAVSGRPHRLALPVQTPAEAMPGLRSVKDAALVFGAERAGLESEEIARCDLILTLPVDPEFESLNLAQAVAVCCYEWARQGAIPANMTPVGDAPLPASRADVAALADHLIAELDGKGFFFPPEKADGMQRNLRTMISRAGFTLAEVRSLRGAIKALVGR